MITKKIIFVLFFLAFCLPPIQSIKADSKDFMVARIIDVETPLGVYPNSTFQIKVIAEYEDEVLADIGIFETDNGRVVESYTHISSFIGPGRTAFYFELTAPSIEGPWSLTAATRAWWKNSWYADPEQGSKPFNITILSFSTPKTIIITNPYSHQLDIELDNHVYTIIPGKNLSLRLDPSTHKITTPAFLKINPHERLLFQAWSDDVTSLNRTFYPINDTTLTPLYQTQYYLTVFSPYGEPLGEGWYNAGITAHIGISPSPIHKTYDATRISYEFDYWTGDHFSQSPFSPLVMDGPKRVEAVWKIVEKKAITSILYISSVFLFLFSISILTALYLLHRSRRTSLKHAALEAVQNLRRLLILFFTLLAASQILVSPIAGCAYMYPESIDIGTARWHYWNTAGADTCLIWLGGGVLGYELHINPFWLESYNTMQFVQDLSAHYSILAIEKGADMMIQSQLNRTVHTEIYRQNGFLSEAREWAEKQGYRYIYLVGYSVGGVAAAEEATLADTEGWASPNGIILITVPISTHLTANVKRLQSNLLILYGEKMTPFYITSGIAYFNKTLENEEEPSILHRELYVMDKVAHEVWTIAETGVYNPAATALVVHFLETAKILHFQNNLNKNLNEMDHADINGRINVESMVVHHPSKVMTNTILHVTAEIASDPGERLAVTLREVGSDELVAVAESSIDDAQELSLTLRSPPTSTVWRLILDLYLWDGEHWVLVSTPPRDPFEIIVSTTISFKLTCGFPNVTVMIDDRDHISSRKGEILIELPQGEHTIDVQPIYQLSNNTQLVFAGWTDKDQTHRRSIHITSDSHLTAILRKQYYFTVQSDHGEIIGAGWYDENSLVPFSVSPPTIEENNDGYVKTFIFNGWNHNTDAKDPHSYITLTSPTTIQAHWKTQEFERNENDQEDFIDPLLTLGLAITLFTTSITLFIKKRHILYR
ncbi:hypothetical protein [[Eubacterium] cellulosolvens]